MGWMDGWMDGQMDGQTDGRTDGGTYRRMDGWRSTNHWKGGWMVRQGPKMLGFRWAAQGAWSLIFTLFLEGVFFRFFSILGRFWEGLGGQNGGQNRVLGGLLSMFFLNAFRHRFFVEFERLGR